MQMKKAHVKLIAPNKCWLMPFKVFILEKHHVQHLLVYSIVPLLVSKGSPSFQIIIYRRSACLKMTIGLMNKLLTSLSCHIGGYTYSIMSYFQAAA